MREGVAMKKEELRKLILTAKGAVEADVVIKNCKVVNVFTGEIQEGDIAISGDQIAGVGQYQGKVEVDAADMPLPASLTAISILNPLM